MRFVEFCGQYDSLALGKFEENNQWALGMLSAV